MQKRSFTLLEILLALMILSILAAFTGVPIKKLIDTHRFERDISTFFISLQEAQTLSAVYQTDIACEIFQEKGSYYYRFSTKEPFTSHQFSKTSHPLSRTQLIQFNGKKTPHHRFDIYSGGRIEPRGILSFSQTLDPNSRQLWFDLQYGHLIKYISK